MQKQRRKRKNLCIQFSLIGATLVGVDIEMMLALIMGVNDFRLKDRGSRWTCLHFKLLLISFSLISVLKSEEKSSIGSGVYICIQATLNHRKLTVFLYFRQVINQKNDKTRHAAERGTDRQTYRQTDSQTTTYTYGRTDGWNHGMMDR